MSTAGVAADHIVGDSLGSSASSKGAAELGAAGAVAAAVDRRLGPAELERGKAGRIPGAEIGDDGDCGPLLGGGLGLIDGLALWGTACIGSGPYAASRGGGGGGLGQTWLIGYVQNQIVRD